jgi:uncharacterized membrane protein
MAKKEKRLAALIFDDPYKADEARAALLRMAGEGLGELDETAVIVKKVDGTMSVFQEVNVIARDQQIGHYAGLLAAAITGTTPLIMVGTVAGRLIGRFTDEGVTNSFIDKVKRELTPLTSALLICGYADSENRPKIVAKMRSFGPKLVESTLPPELEEEIKTALQQG